MEAAVILAVSRVMLPRVVLPYVFSVIVRDSNTHTHTYTHRAASSSTATHGYDGRPPDGSRPWAWTGHGDAAHGYAYGWHAYGRGQASDGWTTATAGISCLYLSIYLSIYLSVRVKGGCIVVALCFGGAVMRRYTSDTKVHQSHASRGLGRGSKRQYSENNRTKSIRSEKQ